MRLNVLNLTTSRNCVIVVALLATNLSCSETREGTSTTTSKKEIDCRVIDQEAAALIVVKATQANGAKLLDQAIAQCPADARRYHQRAMVSAALGDEVMEKNNMNLAIKIAEDISDRCLLDQMLLEKKGLELRKQVSELPATCLNNASGAAQEKPSKHKQ